MTGNLALGAGGDRRIRKTRKALRDALVELILEKGYSAVTVGEIVDRADVGRTTFYAHFTDKDDLLLSGFEELHATSGFADGGDGLSALRLLSRQLVRHADAERRLYRAVFGYRGAGPLHARMESQLCAFVEEILAAAYPAAGAMALSMAARMTTTAFLGLIAWWLDGDESILPDSVADAVEKFTLPALAGLLGPSPA